MDYELADSSGTDDDLLPSRSNRIPSGSCAAENGRSVVGSMPYPRMYSDIETQIHKLEQEGYSSVLRAFKAQSDAITWEKEGLITELRKELRVSDDEHRELLTRVNADDVICRIREWRQAGGNHNATLGIPQPIHDLIPSPTVSASRKKQKTSRSMSFGVASQGLHPQSIPASMQPSPAAVKHGPAFGVGGKNFRPSMQYPSMVSTGRGQLTNQSSSGPVTNEPAEAVIGRTVMTRWPEDDNFYEAVIKDYNPVEGRHALVYDIHTANETWEWIDLKEIPPEDILWEGECPGRSHRGGHGGRGVGVKNSMGHGVLGAGSRRGSKNDQFKNEFTPSRNGIVKEVSDDIEILHTETLVKEVEKVFNSSHLDLLEIEKAKKMLKEHEQALIDVIAKLADASDSESDEGQPLSHEHAMDRNMQYSGNQHRPNLQAKANGASVYGSEVGNQMAIIGQTVSDNQQDDFIDDV
ncbi:protein EMSY-LIKE 3-like isoform X2 [Cornus florida]|uniref:protein EMSY-LIKE 3-like isoform X2 n=1 Tax=Cornus florida TaxID=4283 RepID=UPI0028A1583F|nr:protein EMSY-LIKE 3-like isoform X2 [Cornus florida]